MDHMKEFEGYTSKAGIAEHALELAEEMFIALSSAGKNYKGVNKRSAYAACVYFALHGKYTIHEIELMFDIPKNFPKMCTKVQGVLSELDGGGSWSSIFYDKEFKGNDGSDTIGRMVGCQIDIPQNQMRFIAIQCKKVWDILKRDKLLINNNGQGVNIAIIYSVCIAMGIAIQVEDIITFCTSSGFSVCRNNFVENLNVVKSIVDSIDMSRFHLNKRIKCEGV